MTDVLPEVDAPSDAELISRVRGGDVAAYGDLFSRHQAAANRLARQLIRGSDADDLVSEAFAKVLTVLQGGAGPDVAFRAYLLTAVRRLHVDRVRSGQRLQTTDDMTPFDPGVPFQDTAVAGFENGAAAKAFASLPERWQLVLWHLEVEGQKPADIAPLLGMSPNSVSALAYRAREGLRQAFLTMHLSDLSETDCRWVTEHLGAFVRKGLAKRDATKVQEHLDGCRRCTAMYLELTEVNSNLAGIIAPLLLGAAAAGYLSSGGAGAAGVLGLVSKAKELVAANTGAVTAAGVGAAVVAAAVTAITLSGNHGHKPDLVADPPGTASTAAAPSPALPGASQPGSRRSSSPSSAGSTAGSSAAVTPAGAVLAAVASPGVTSPAEPPTGDGSTTDSPTSGTTDDPTGPTGPTGSAGSPLTIAGTTIDDDGVNLVATADPMPDVLTVDLVSQPSGVVFGSQQPAGCTLVTATQVQCLTGTGTGGARLPGTAAAANPTTFNATLPFGATTVDDADLSIAVNGIAATGVTHHFSRDVDVALTFDGPAARPDGNTYTVHGTLGVTGPRAGSVQRVVYTMTGGAFGIGDSVVTRDAAPRNQSFTVVPDDAQHPDVRISAAPLPALHDTDSTNDGEATALDLKPYDVKVTSLAADEPVADPAKQQSFTGVLDNDGFPGTVDLAVTKPDDDEVGEVILGTDGKVHFTVSGTHPGDVSLAAQLPDSYTGDDRDNDAATAAFTPHAFGLDVALSGFPSDVVHPGAGDVYTVSGNVDVTGPAADELDTITYRASGGTFTTASGVEIGRTVTLLTSVDAPTFHLVPDDLVSPGVTISVDPSALGDYVDSQSGDDTATLHLARYDVRLDALTPEPAVANPSKQETFTATVHDDGFPDPLSFAVTEPDGDVASPVTRTGDSVSFTVTGSEPGPVTLEASLPAGWTDADGSDNVTDGTFTPHSFGLDVALSGFPVDLVHPAANDVYEVSGHVTETGPASGELGNVTYQVTGARFVGADAGTDGRRLTLPATEHDPSFRLLPDDPADPGDVTVSVDRSALGDYVDTDTTDDTAPLQLGRYDLRLGALLPGTAAANRSGQQSFTATLDDGGFLGKVDFAATTPQGDTVGEVSRGDGTVTVTVTGKQPGTVTLSAALPAGWTDAADADNHTSATFTPHDFDLDVALRAPTTVLHPGEDDVYSVPGLVAVTGPAATELDTITYTVSGGTFTSPLATSAGRTLTLPATETTPTFWLRPDDLATPGPVEITASVDDEFTDTDATDDGAPVHLARYDVKVGPLTADGPAGPDHTQSFTAVLDPDGFTGTLALSVSHPDGDTLGAVARSGNTVHFTVTGANPGPISLTATLPAGWTDANASDNTASTAFTLPPVDATVETSQDIHGESGQGTVTASVSVKPQVGLRLDVSFDGDKVTVQTPDGCSVTDSGLTCSYTGAATETFKVSLVDRMGNETSQATIGFQVSAPGYEDTDPADNTSTESVSRKE